MNSKNLKGLCEAYGGIYTPQELTEEQVWEEVESWVSSLIEEGYDLSDYTWEEMYEAYLEEKDVVKLPGNKSVTIGTGYNSVLGGQPGRTIYQRTPGSNNRVQRSFKANPVLSVRNGVKGTGVGKDFKAQPWSSAATARYDKQSVENKRNASKALVAATNKDPNIKPSSNSRSTGSEVNPPSQASPRPTTPTTTRRPSVASSPRPAATPAAQPKKPTTPTGPAVGKLGSTSFERRTPTSAELKAAQAARAGGASPEKVLQAAQKTNLPTTGPTPAVPDLKSVNAGLASFKPRDMTKNPLKPTPPTTMKNSYEWGSTSKLVDDIANLYQSVYEAKKVDQDKDGDNDFADVRIARLIASGVSKEEAIRRVRDKSYNEEVEIDEATRMRRELGKEGEIATRKELASRSKAYQRSGSVDRTIATAEREADRTTARNRDETSDDYKNRMQNRSKTLRGLAANRRKSVRSGEGLRGYAAKVEGGDKDLQSARGSARSAGTLTPAEKKRLGEEFDLWVNALIYEGYDLSEYTWDEMVEIYEETANEKEERIAARRARIKEMEAQGRVMTSSKRASQKAAQRKQEKKEEMADRLLRSIQASGSTRSSSTPMGTKEPEEKPEAPAANRKLGGKVKKDDLASQANAILRTIKNENIQLWVNELINEGYDLTGWTSKEITKLYFEIFE
jgi:hypothetical protein